MAASFDIGANPIRRKEQLTDRPNIRMFSAAEHHLLGTAPALSGGGQDDDASVSRNRYGGRASAAANSPRANAYRAILRAQERI